MSTQRRDGIITFAHIPKTAGMTVQFLLRRHFGIRHLDLPRGFVYTKELLSRDLKLSPQVRSLAGHSLRPFVDFGTLDDRLVWYTFLREPVNRLLSHYQHAVEKNGVTAPLDRWMTDRTAGNWQVGMLSGAEDLDAAKQILDTKIRCVGLMERFDESLLLIRHRLQLPHFNVAYGKPRNTARRSDLRKRICEQCERHREEVMERNALDLALYDYAVNELYPRQVAEYGEDRLRGDLETAFGGIRRTVPEFLRYYECVLFRKAFFLPMAKILGHRAGPPVKVTAWP